MVKHGKKSKDYSRIKMILVMALFGLSLAGLWVRAGWVQLHDGPRLQKMASRQNLAAEFERGERGRILDRNGQMLATSVEAKSVYARPVEASASLQKSVAVLSRILHISPTRVRKKLSSKRPFIWIKRQVTDREALAVDKAKLPGVHLTSEFTRLYPNGHLAGQVLGFVDVDGMGREGVEREFQKRMVPGKARFVVQRDASGRRLYLDADGREVDVNGKDVRLTIDTQIQHAAEQSLANAIRKYEARAGIVVVVDVPTGEILALANAPFFNPNIFRKSRADQRRARSLTDVYEPGSTLKPLLFAAALEEGVITRDTLIDCENGRYRVARKVIRDTHPARWLPANKVLRYSSNIGCVKIAADLGADVYHSYLTKLGFGERTGLRLPGESGGIVMPPTKWTSVDLAAISFGQGIAATAIQMSKAFLCLANGGETRRLTLVKSPSPAAKDRPVRIFSRETADTVLSMMREVVQEDGTGRSARIPGISMAGKTGTAQKASREGGYGKEYLSSFVGLIPAEKPELLFLAMIDEPQKSQYGSKVAAPVVREVAIRSLAYLDKLPDNISETAVAVSAPRTKDGATDLAAALPAPRPVTVSGTVPALRGLPVRRAVEALARKGIVPVLKGDGMTVDKQKPAAGQPWPDATGKGGKDDVFVLWLS
ncbi:penicillin-binding transpeptidase domain-containing protein [Pseudodesulfovibrio tunisiensis]|uniref:penicillin-binding transpeptidase domain-containing protein n=1 Tax=Pseudodesulfovibrio tunisiensis TaxID=463192 RepID=UPI001FB4E5C4|nr:penicillin-binding transpeptidase domain-containing protein [Pseudodesulfovibrio tunisiensis]